MAPAQLSRTAQGGQDSQTRPGIRLHSLQARTCQFSKGLTTSVPQQRVTTQNRPCRAQIRAHHHPRHQQGLSSLQSARTGQRGCSGRSLVLNSQKIHRTPFPRDRFWLSRDLALWEGSKHLSKINFKKKKGSEPPPVFMTGRSWVLFFSFESKANRSLSAQGGKTGMTQPAERH